MPAKTDPDAVLRLVEEELHVGARQRETGRVRVSVRTENVAETVEQTLRHSYATVERVPVDREVSELPVTREENGILIVPVVEEILVVEKRLVLREEIHLRMHEAEEMVQQPVERRVQHAVIERLAPEDGDPSASPGNDTPGQRHTMTTGES